MKRFIVITRPEFFENEEIIINRLFDDGLQNLHLRKPEASKQEIERLLKQIHPSYYPRIILHEHLDLATIYPMGGVHLNRRSPEIPQGFVGSISRSCHSLEEVVHYKALDYLFLSPIFPSISKAGYGEAFPLEQLKKATEEGLINRQIIALGGMDAHTIPQLRGIGFGGVAVLGALWGESPSVESVIKHYHQLKKAAEQI